MKKGIEITVALVSLFSLIVGILTAVSGPLGDISPIEASVCLWAGIAMAVFGFLGFYFAFQRKEKWITEGTFVFIQSVAFASIFIFGPW